MFFSDIMIVLNLGIVYIVVVIFLNLFSFVLNSGGFVVFIKNIMGRFWFVL